MKKEYIKPSVQIDIASMESKLLVSSIEPSSLSKIEIGEEEAEDQYGIW